MARRPKVLLAVTVYNGWDFVPRCLRSALHLDTNLADIDVLALDDASPEPGFSDKLHRLCSEIGVNYYRTPRNLGIVRNVNLGLLTAVAKGYDYVIISNSDVIYSRQTVDYLIEAAISDPRIGSVTAWSNNVSIYSIPNVNPDQNLASQEMVDWLAASLAGAYRGVALDIPAGISFSLLIPTAAIRQVGLMDPVFGRGYCEETDWSLRSVATGHRLTLAPAAFVYHQGRGSTLAAGMVTGGHTTVPQNEAIIDHRYPLFRSNVESFCRGGILQRLHTDAVRQIIRDAGAQFGFDVQLWQLPADDRYDRVHVRWNLTAKKPVIEASFRGFRCSIPGEGKTPYDAVVAFFGGQPHSATVLSGIGRQPAAAAAQPEPAASPEAPGRTAAQEAGGVAPGPGIGSPQAIVEAGPADRAAPPEYPSRV